jgi:hypothetical protein
MERDLRRKIADDLAKFTAGFDVMPDPADDGYEDGREPLRRADGSSSTDVELAAPAEWLLDQRNRASQL